MTKMVGHFMIFMSFSFISTCYCIGFEYYDDKSFLPDNRLSVRTEGASTSHARRAGDENDLLKNLSVSKHEASKHRSSNTHDDTQDPKNFKESCIKYKQNDCKPNLIIDAVKENTLGHRNLNLRRLDYENVYDDDINPPTLLENLTNIEEAVSANHSDDIRFPLNEFYNLESAVQHLNVKSHHAYSKHNNKWYTLEDQSCWDLPILYGELGRKKDISEVFLMSAEKLKNVIEKKNDKDWISEYQIKKPPLTYYTRKWCTVEPCYGDHTLCLFSEFAMSTLCDKKCKVKVPNMLEQTALVNTLNSMRNKIANGKSDRYRHLPTASNMRQIIYDNDLEKIAKVWLLQCLPGPAPCSALDGSFVTQLECTKYAKHCCVNSQTDKCTPKPECFLLPVIGCLHLWYWSAGDKLTSKDVHCGHTSVSTYSTAQLLWATTFKIGCAYSENINGDIRVVCNFSPGAPFMLRTKLFCGIVPHEAMNTLLYKINDTRAKRSFGINVGGGITRKSRNVASTVGSNLKDSDTESKENRCENTLCKIYKGWLRHELRDYNNGTMSLRARLVTKYEFVEQNMARCDSDRPIYSVGGPGSLCLERGRRFQSLCYDYRDPTPAYRLVAVLAPIALFLLILYDLFSGVMRQTNY